MTRIHHRADDAPLRIRAGEPDRSPRTFARGVSVLTISALLVKIIGLCYRVPLLTYLGTEGMGYFNTAYELYALFCVVATAGLPVAMSVRIAACETEKAGGGVETARETVRLIFRTALLLFCGMGVCGSLILYLGSDVFARWIGNEKAAACMRVISPTVFLICLSSAFRGYFQGRRDMKPTAVSQVIEALGKLVLGLGFAAYARSMGKDLPTTAAYAVAGLTVGTAISLLYLAVRKYRSGVGKECRERPEADLILPRRRVILRQLLATAIPVTGSAAVVGLVKCLDMAMILRRLPAIGYTTAQANALYGCYSTLAVPVCHILPSLSTSVALSVVPALSGAISGGKAEAVRKTAVSAFRMTAFTAIPAALGLAVFAEDILCLLFRGQAAAVHMAAPWLACLGLSVPAVCLMTVTGAMLQAAGHPVHPVMSMLAGCAVKGIVAYWLIGCPDVGMMGAPVSSLCCDTVIALLNGCFLLQDAPSMIPSKRTACGLFLFPLMAGSAAVLMARWVRQGLGWHASAPLETIGTILIVVILYGALMAVSAAQKRKKYMIDKGNDEP